MPEPGDITPDTHPEAPREALSPRKRWRRRLLWAGAALALAVLGLWLFLMWFTQPRRLAAFIGPRIEAATGMEFTVASISRRGLSRFRLDSLRLGHETPFLTLDRLELNWQPLDLLARRLQLDSLVVEGLSVNLIWQDSLLLPDWLKGGAPEPSTASDSALVLPEWLLDERVRIEPGAFVLRRFRASLEVRDSLDSWAVTSPPLGLRLDLPGFSGPQLGELAAGRLPSGLRTGLALDWQGGWLGNPPNRQELDPLLLVMPGAPDQDIRYQAQLERDTLRMDLAWSLALPDLHLQQGTTRLPLPDSLHLALGLQASHGDSTRVGLKADWKLFPLGGSGGLELALVGDRLPEGFTLELDHSLDPSTLGPWLPWADASLADLGLASAPLELELATRGRISAQGLEGALPLSVSARWQPASLSWPSYGLNLDQLRLESRTRLDLDPAHPEDPRNLVVEARLGLARLRPALEPWLDPAGIAALPPALRAPEIRNLNATVDWRSPGLEEPSVLSADLELGRLLQSALFLSTRLELPGLSRLAQGILPAGRLDLQSEPIPLAQLDPMLGGAASLGGWFELGDPRFTSHLELVPQGWKVTLPGEPAPMPIPLHSLELDLAGYLEDYLPVLESVQVRPAPFAPLSIEGELDFLAGGKLELDWPGLELAMVQRRLPESLQVLSRLEGRVNTLLSVELDSTLMPVRVDGLVTGQGIRLAMDQTVDADGLGLELAGFWTPDSARGGLDFRLGRTRISGLPKELKSLSGRLDGHLMERLVVDGRMTVPDYLSTVDLGLRADSLNALPRCEAVVQVLLDTRGSELEVWPGVVLVGSQDLGAVLSVHDLRFIQLDAWSVGLLDQVRYEDLATLSRVKLDLSASQLLDLEHPDYLAPGSLVQPPADWNSQLTLLRSAPGVASLSPEGWSVEVGEINSMDWILEELALDLRIAGRRLDCPQLQAKAYGGTIAGSAWLDLPGALDEPAYSLDLWAMGLDSRRFRFAGSGSEGEGKGLGRGKAVENRLDLVVNLAGKGITLESLDTATGRLRLPGPGRQVTLNLLWALDERGADPTIGRIRKLLDLPGFKYSVESLDFDLSNGFVKPRVALRKSPFSPLPNVVFPMSPLPLGFLVRTFALTEEEE